MSKEEMKKLSLLEKLLEVQKHIDNVTKDAIGGAGNFKYDYVSDSKILSIVRPLMNDLGLLLVQEVVSIKNERIDYTVGRDSRPKSEILTTTEQKFTWISVPDGEKLECSFAANGMNEWEKGLGSSLTYAERYFFLKFFHIQTDSDDVDNRDRKRIEVSNTYSSKAPSKSSGNTSTKATAKQSDGKPKISLHKMDGSDTMIFKKIKQRIKDKDKNMTMANLESVYTLSPKDKEELKKIGL